MEKSIRLIAICLCLLFVLTGASPIVLAANMTEEQNKLSTFISEDPMVERIRKDMVSKGLIYDPTIKVTEEMKEYAEQQINKGITGPINISRFIDKNNESLDNNLENGIIIEKVDDPFKTNSISQSGVGTLSLGDSPAEAINLPLDYNYTASILPAGDYDWFKITASKGSRIYKIYTTGSTDTYGEIYWLNIFGTPILQASDDNSGSGTNFQILTSLNQYGTGGGAYYIKVRHYSSSGIGNYTIRAEYNTDKCTHSSTYNCKGGKWERNNMYVHPLYDIIAIHYYNVNAAFALYVAMNEGHTVNDI